MLVDEDVVIMMRVHLCSVGCGHLSGADHLQLTQACRVNMDQPVPQVLDEEAKYCQFVGTACVLLLGWL